MHELNRTLQQSRDLQANGNDVTCNEDKQRLQHIHGGPKSCHFVSLFTSLTAVIDLYDFWH